MKKFIAAAILAGLATAAFAQTPAPTFTWGGYLDTGITALANGTDKATLGLWGDDAGVNVGRIKIKGAVALGDNGIKFELRGDGLVNNIDPAKVYGYPVYFKSVYAYTNLFSKMVYAQVGIVNEQTNRPAGDAAPSYSKETAGAVVVVKPLDGLSVNAFVGANNFAPLVNNGSAGANAAANLVDAPTAFGGSYTAKGLVTVDAEAKFKVTNGTANYALSDAYAAVGLLAVPNLNAWLEWQNTGLNKGKLNGKQIATETVNYNFKDLGVAPLTVGVIAYQYLYDTDTKVSGNAADASLRFSPWASYALDGGIVPKLAVTYFSGSEILAAQGSQPYFAYLGLLNAATAGTPDNNKVAVLEVKPSVKFDLGSGAVVTVAYAYTASMGATDVLFLTTNKDAKSVQSFQTNCTFQF
jgi:hypothetical protein